MLSAVSSPNACNLLHLSNSQQVPTIFCAKKAINILGGNRAHTTWRLRH